MVGEWESCPYTFSISWVPYPLQRGSPDGSDTGHFKNPAKRRSWLLLFEVSRA
jgi:hypothetical protein